MRRDTLVFTLAGTVFGLVAGYMGAQWGLVPRPAGVAAADPERGAPPAATAPDPNEVQALESLARRSPEDAGVRVELANLYRDHDRWDDAIRWYEEALASSPDLKDPRNDLGFCLVNAGRPADALPEFEKVLALDATDRNALYNKGFALSQLGRTREAVAAWEEVLRLHHDDPQLQSLRERIGSLRKTVGDAGS
jgi:tetratricopeptide (TPR) repeat protein